MRTMTIMLIVGSMALLIPALYWGVASAQAASGTSLYSPAFVLGQMGLGAAAAGPFMLVKGGLGKFHGGGHFRGFYGGFGYPYGGYYRDYDSFYGDDSFQTPGKVCVWNGYDYTCYRDYETY